MSPAELTLHFRNEETLRDLERVADALGVSPDELAEVAIEHELVSVGVGLDQKLSRTLDRLKGYSEADRERDIEAFSQGEVDFEDPLRARREDPQDAYGIGALFAHPVERG